MSACLAWIGSSAMGCLPTSDKGRCGANRARDDVVAICRERRPFFSHRAPCQPIAKMLPRPLLHRRLGQRRRFQFWFSGSAASATPSSPSPRSGPCGKIFRTRRLRCYAISISASDMCCRRMYCGVRGSSTIFWLIPREAVARRKSCEWWRCSGNCVGATSRRSSTSLPARELSRVKRDRSFFQLAGIQNLIGMMNWTGIRALRTPGRPQPELPREADLLLQRLSGEGVHVPPPGRGKMELGIGAPSRPRSIDGWRVCLRRKAAPGSPSHRFKNAGQDLAARAATSRSFPG